MTLKTKMLNNPLPMATIRKMTKIKMDHSIGARVDRLFEALQKKSKEIAERTLEIHRKYCLVDEKNWPVGLEAGKLQFQEPKETNEIKHDSEFEDVLNEEFDVKVYPIPRAVLGNNFTPEEIGSVNDILEPLED